MEFNPMPPTEDQLAELAQNKVAFDKLIAEIRSRNGESYADRMRPIGAAVAQVDARQEYLA